MVAIEKIGRYFDKIDAANMKQKHLNKLIPKRPRLPRRVNWDLIRRGIVGDGMLIEPDYHKEQAVAVQGETDSDNSSIVERTPEGDEERRPDQEEHGQEEYGQPMAREMTASPTSALYGPPKVPEGVRLALDDGDQVTQTGMSRHAGKILFAKDPDEAAATFTPADRIEQIRMNQHKVPGVEIAVQAIVTSPRPEGDLPVATRNVGQALVAPLSTRVVASSNGSALVAAGPVRNGNVRFETTLRAGHYTKRQVPILRRKGNGNHFQWSTCFCFE